LDFNFFTDGEADFLIISDGFNELFLYLLLLGSIAFLSKYLPEKSAFDILPSLKYFFNNK
jgi:hypothetical protein